MTEYNIKDIKIEINLSSLLNALKLNYAFDIDIDGNIHTNNTIPSNKIIIFSSVDHDISSLLDVHAQVNKLFGKGYKPEIVGSSCVITPLPSWMDILDLNKKTMLYFDHQTDGVEIFEFKDIENIGWNAIPLDITYRELCTYIEKNCEGTFIFYDNGIHFNGFVVANDVNEVKEKLMKYISELIYDKISKKELILNDIDDDQAESLEFFNIK
ncbi:MAG: hypothetical protein HRT43_09745 [Campylobacteraceae bacterium]|nr:hypothetical protein [Campylobacteraceae bacterium]